MYSLYGNCLSDAVRTAWSFRWMIMCRSLIMNITILKNRAPVADYVILMGYDEHTDSSYEAGSVASLGYLEDGITDALEKVPETKLIAAVPFYTRLWFETPKTEDELAAEAGTEAASYPDKISSEAAGDG